MEPYTHKSFFEEIPDLKDKKLLDVGAGGDCISSRFGYLSQLAEIHELAKEPQIFEGNIIALDSSYNKRYCILPQRLWRYNIFAI
ncbi:MAG: hypothetical protein DRN71_01245 [Candidatus Nanohalarchaeota archaeon]|nr:MAG: hypothetical protein DRN71_01245 [Candidatus Nanohaloarchaeota archaeon]